MAIFTAQKWGSENNKLTKSGRQIQKVAYFSVSYDYGFEKPFVIT